MRVFKPVTVSFRVVKAFTIKGFKTRWNSLCSKAKRSGSINIFRVFMASGDIRSLLSLDEISFTSNSLQLLQVSSAAWKCAPTSPGQQTGSTHGLGGLLAQGDHRPPNRWSQHRKCDPCMYSNESSLFLFQTHNFTWSTLGDKPTY